MANPVRIVTEGARVARRLLSPKQEAKLISISSAKTRANIDKMEKSGNYKKTTVTPKKPSAKPEPTKKSTIAVVGRELRKKAEPKLTPKDPALQTPTSKEAVLEKERYVASLVRKPGTRNRDVKKPSTQTLTPREKLYETLGKKARVTKTKGKPLTKQDRAKARKAKFDKVLERKQISKADNPLYKKMNPKATKREPVLQPEAAERAKNATPKTRKPSDAPPISAGRGNTQQPPSVTTQKPRRTRTERIEQRKTKRANIRDRKTDIREASTPGFEKLQPVRRGKPKTAEQRAEGRDNAEARTRFEANSKKGSKMSRRSTTNDPRNARSDAGFMSEKMKEINAADKARARRRELYKGNNKLTPKQKAKIDKTLEETARNAKGRKLQNVMNKPVIKRNTKTGRIKVTRPIRPNKK